MQRWCPFKPMRSAHQVFELHRLLPGFVNHLNMCSRVSPSGPACEFPLPPLWWCHILLNCFSQLVGSFKNLKTPGIKNELKKDLICSSWCPANSFTDILVVCWSRKSLTSQEWKSLYLTCCAAHCSCALEISTNQACLFLVKCLANLNGDKIS